MLTLKADRGHTDHEGHWLTPMQTQRPSLMDCLARFSGLGCNDPRDKLFGLMGHVLEGQGINVDHAKLGQNLLLDLLRTCMKSDTDRFSYGNLRNLGVQMRLLVHYMRW